MKKQLRIVLLSTSMGMGGTDQQITLLSRCLSSLGHKVSVISLIETAQMGEELADYGIDVYHLGMKRGIPDPRGIVRLINILSDLNPHILNSFLLHANIICRLASLFASVPVVVTSIRSIDYCNRIECIIHRLTNWIDDACVTNSYNVANKMIERRLVKKEKLNVIYNLINLNLYKPVNNKKSYIRQWISVDKNTFIWIAVGRLQKQKDYPTLLNAVANISSEYSYHVVIVGDGREKEYLQSMITRLDIEDKISFLGVRRDVDNLLSSSDAFVLSSSSEGLPNVVIEALASGLPVVATDVGGVSELIKNNETGLLVPTEDYHRLSEAMIKIMNMSNKKRVLMGENGRNWIDSKFNLKNTINDWLSLYKKLLD